MRCARSEEQLLRAMLAGALRQVVASGGEIAAGSAAAYDVHQLRVGLRRVRTALRAFGEAAPSLAECEPPIASAFRALGIWRDSAITQEDIGPQLRAVGAPSVRLPSNASEPSPAMIARGAELQIAVAQLVKFTREPADAQQASSAKGAQHRLDELVGQKLAKLHKQVLRGCRAFGQLGQDEQHRVRKHMKRLQYLSEFVEPRYRHGVVKRYLKALMPAQHALGAHHDVVVALESYRELAMSDSNALFAVGWLTAKLEQTAKESHRTLIALTAARRFWRGAR